MGNAAAQAPFPYGQLGRLVKNAFDRLCPPLHASNALFATAMFIRDWRTLGPNA